METAAKRTWLGTASRKQPSGLSAHLFLPGNISMVSALLNTFRIARRAEIDTFASSSNAFLESTSIDLGMSVPSSFHSNRYLGWGSLSSPRSECIHS